MFKDLQIQKMLKHIAPEDIPASEDLYSAAELEEHLSALGEPPLSLIVVGDIMLGDRSEKVLKEQGADYLFMSVGPILRRAGMVLGNLEGPLARNSTRVMRHYSYRVNPDLATALTRAGISILTLANNHALDCGREGVLETLDAVAQAGAAALGAGANEQLAHTPVIRLAGQLDIGLLGYYWNRRCAATADLPGVAIGSREALAADIHALRDKVDRVVVTFHWGVPYEREPTQKQRTKAHFAVDCGADAVIGHHPHIVQPLEIYNGCPIFYSLGNFIFGSRNSRAEGLLVGLRFEEAHTIVHAYPLYVKNRDLRVNYQPKVLRGTGAERVLHRLMGNLGPVSSHLVIGEGRGTLRLQRLVIPQTGP